MRGSAAFALGQLGHSQALAPLFESLRDADSYLRESAVSALGRLGRNEVVAPLIERLRDVDSTVRWSAASALGRLGISEAVTPLIESLKDFDRFVRRRAATALGQLGSPDAVAPLIESLNDGDPDVRKSAVTALGQLDGSKAEAQLIESLHDTDSDVRGRAASALGALGRSEEAVKTLIESLRDADSDVRASAASALGQLGHTAAVAPLTESLKDADTSVRLSAAAALGQLGSSVAVAPLIESLKNADANVRLSAAATLGQLGSSEAVAPLIESLKDADRRVRLSAAAALGQLGSSEAVAPLIESLGDSDVFIRSNAVSALGKLGSLEAMSLLIKSLNDADRFVRQSSTSALGDMGSSKAEPVLIKHLRDGDIDKCYVASVLGELGSSDAVAPLIQCVGAASVPARRKALVVLGNIGEARVKETVSALFRADSEIRSVKVAAAATLLALGSDEGLSYLRSAVNSPLSSARREIASTLSELRINPRQTLELLEPLLDDAVLSVKVQALKALKHAEASQALSYLLPKLEDPDTKIRKAVAETLAELASPQSVPAIRSALAKDPDNVGINIILLNALRRIGTPEAVDALLDAARENETLFGFRTYHLLGELEARRALPWLEESLVQLVDKTRKWRSIRDSERENFNQEEAEEWATDLEAATPDWHRAFELGYAIARIDPDGRGVKLLSHELADVRYGAWMGLGEVGTVDLVRRLDVERDENRSYPFRDSAYRAIDHMLRRFEGTASDDELRALKELLPAVRDRKAVCTRLEWTIRMLDKEGPLLDGHCEINWRNPSP